MPETIIEVSQYKGQKSLVINCTQLGDSFTPQYKTAKQKRAVLDEWCDFLRSEQDAFNELDFCTKMPQELFDAVCYQRNLKSLHIKWGSYECLDALVNLSSLKRGASVKSIAPIATLTGLESLAVENFQKISDYSALSNLQNLKSLEISGDGLSPKFIHIESLEFLRQMPGLTSFVILTARLKSKDYSPILSLKSLTHLSLPPQHALFGLFDELSALPNLKTGLLKERAEIYHRK